MRRCRINLTNRCQRLISRAEWHTVRLKGASGESEGLRRYDKEVFFLSVDFATAHMMP